MDLSYQQSTHANRHPFSALITTMGATIEYTTFVKICSYPLPRLPWTEDKISVLALKIFTQAEGQQNEILTIKHPSSPDKAVKIPLRSVNNIDLIIGRENHWVYRAIREQQTLLQRYELEDFLLRTR